MSQNRSKSRHAKPDRRGIALLIVFLVVTILGLLGMQFVHLMSVENRATHHTGNQLQADYLVSSAEAAVEAVLAKSPTKRTSFGGIYDNPDKFKAAVVIGRNEILEQATETVRGCFSVVSPKIEDERFNGIRFGLENESARLNLALLPIWEKEKDGSAINALMSLPEMTTEQAEAILDWVDADQIARSNGAEADYYQSRELPYVPRNGVPGCLEELLLIKGISRDLFWGADRNANFMVDSNESDENSGGSTSSEENLLPWASLLTVYSAEQNTDSQGCPKINLNDPKLARLHAAMTKAFGKNEADFVILYRQFGPAKKGQTGTAVALNQISSPDLTKRGKFKFKTPLDLLGVSIILPAAGAGSTKQKLISPWPAQWQQNKDRITQLIDRTTTTGKKRIVGRINIDLAPKSVLACLPDLDEIIVDRIVSARPTAKRLADSRDLRLPIWPWTEGIIDLTQMKALFPFATTGGDVHRAQLVGFFDPEGPRSRAEIVIDATGDRPRRVYWKDLTLFGLGHTRQSLGGTEELEQNENSPPPASDNNL
jgi:type II secretory pathway component PulK